MEVRQLNASHESAIEELNSKLEQARKDWHAKRDEQRAEIWDLNGKVGLVLTMYWSLLTLL